MVSDLFPALVGLALDVGLRRLPLGVEGVELLFEPMIGRDAGVDRATLRLLDSGLRRTLPPAPVVRLADAADELRAALGRLAALPRATAPDLGFGSPARLLAQMRS
jgi:hypothetical protein